MWMDKAIISMFGWTRPVFNCLEGQGQNKNVLTDKTPEFQCLEG